MKITKIGHCCLVLEFEEGRILTDPGVFTVEEAKKVQDVDVILITHEHSDHFHVECIEAVLKNNPAATVVSNGAVAKLLAEKDIPCMVVGDTQTATVSGLLIEGFGKDHAQIYGTTNLVENTGYLVASKFYFPGDAFHDPQRPVEILALPVAGPWMKISEAIDFAKKVKPRAAFPVHDGMIIPGAGSFVTRILQSTLDPEGIVFVPLTAGENGQF